MSSERRRSDFILDFNNKDFENFGQDPDDSK